MCSYCTTTLFALLCFLFSPLSFFAWITAWFSLPDVRAFFPFLLFCSLFLYLLRSVTIYFSIVLINDGVGDGPWRHIWSLNFNQPETKQSSLLQPFQANICWFSLEGLYEARLFCQCFFTELEAWEMPRWRVSRTFWARKLTMWTHWTLS